MVDSLIFKKNQVSVCIMPEFFGQSVESVKSKSAPEMQSSFRCGESERLRLLYEFQIISHPLRAGFACHRRGNHMWIRQMGYMLQIYAESVDLCAEFKCEWLSSN